MPEAVGQAPVCQLPPHDHRPLSGSHLVKPLRLTGVPPPAVFRPSDGVCRHPWTEGAGPRRLALGARTKQSLRDRHSFRLAARPPMNPRGPVEQVWTAATGWLLPTLAPQVTLAQMPTLPTALISALTRPPKRAKGRSRRTDAATQPPVQLIRRRYYRPHRRKRPSRQVPFRALRHPVANRPALSRPALACRSRSLP